MAETEKVDHKHVIILPPLTIHSAVHCQLSTESEKGLARTCCIYLQMNKAFTMLTLHTILWYAGFWHFKRMVNTYGVKISACISKLDLLGNVQPLFNFQLSQSMKVFLTRQC